MKTIPFARPDITEEEVSAVSAVLRSGWLSVGPKTKEFEQRFAEYVGAPEAAAVNSGTSGLHLALLALGVGPGDEVIVPSYTFTASAATVVHCGATPRLVDVEPAHLNIDPNRVEEAITPRTKAIMVVHFGGRACDLEAIGELARKHGLGVVEDAAHALPSRAPWGLVGGGPNVVVFSFYATKPLATGEGGMVTSGVPSLMEKIRLMSLHGMSRDAWKRYLTGGSWFYEVISPGFKYNMGDVQAALGLVQLSRVRDMVDRRVGIARKYAAGLGDCPEVEIPSMEDAEGNSWHLYALRLNLERLRVGRNEFIENLAARGVGTGVHFIPLHLHPYYRDALNVTPAMFPVSQREYEREISLPIYSSMTDDEIDYVLTTVRDICRENAV